MTRPSDPKDLKYPNIFVCTLKGSLALGGSETVIKLSSIMTLDGQVLDADNFEFTGRGVLSVDVQSVQRAEFISFTAIDVGSKSVTGAIRGLSFVDDSVIASNKKFHAVGAPVIIAFGTHNLRDISKLLADAGLGNTGIARLTQDPAKALATPTITIATPAVITSVAHGLTAGDQVVFGTSGALPDGIEADKTYYVSSQGLATDTFEISTRLNDDLYIVNTSGSQSGVHTLTRVTPYAIGENDPILNDIGKVKVDSADINADYLDDKQEFVGGVNVTIVKTILNPGVNEKIRYTISFSGGGGGGQAAIQFQQGGVNLGTAGTADTFNVVGPGGTLSRVGNVLTLTLSGGGGGGGSDISDTITQALHGFPVGIATAVRLTAGGTYVESLAVKASSTDLSAEVIGLAVAIDANDFTLYYGGKVLTTDFGAEDAGTPLFLDDTIPGLLTVVEPIAIGTVSKPVGYVDVPGTSMVMYNYRGLENISSGVGSGEFFSTVTTLAGDAATGQIVIPHGLIMAPRFVKITATKTPGTSGSSVLEYSQSFGTSDGVNNNCVYNGYNSSSTGGLGGRWASNDNTNAMVISDVLNQSISNQKATVSFDATNIYIDHVLTLTPMNTNINILVEAEV